jgi:hypothetical protein
MMVPADQQGVAQPPDVAEPFLIAAHEIRKMGLLCPGSGPTVTDRYSSVVAMVFSWPKWGWVKTIQLLRAIAVLRE